MNTKQGYQAEYAVGQYSPTDALSFCLASQLAYSRRKDTIDRDAIESKVNSWGFHDVEIFEIVRGWNIDTQGYVAIDSRRILVVFRGTESARDWRTNLRAVTDPGPWLDTRVHEGFLDAFVAIAFHVGEIIGRRATANHEIWVTGHSLGGALAVLLTATLCESGKNVSGLYTFAAPRVGDPAFVKELDTNMQSASHWRVVNAGDLVPHLPLEPLFSHGGKRVLLMGNGNVSHTEEDWRGMKTGMLRWIDNVISERALNIKAPHSLEGKYGYIQRLRNSLP